MARGIRARLLAGAFGCAVAFGLASEARANLYVYSVQQTSGYSFTGGTVLSLTPLTGSSSAQLGNPSGSDGHTGTLDVLQSYVGPGPAPAQNTFTAAGQTNADYARGDALMGNPATAATFTTNNVAEAYMVGPGNSSSAGSWGVDASIQLTVAGQLSLSFNYLNKLTAIIDAGSSGTVTADYSYTVSVRDSQNNEVFKAAPSQLNNNISLSAPGTINVPPGSGPATGPITLTTGTLAVGIYTVTLTGTENTHIVANAVPEPSTLISAAFGLALAGGAALRNRRRAAK